MDSCVFLDAQIFHSFLNNPPSIFEFIIMDFEVFPKSAMNPLKLWEEGGGGVEISYKNALWNLEDVRKVGLVLCAPWN